MVSVRVQLALLAIAKDPTRPDLTAVELAEERATAAGHRVVARQVVGDDEVAIREQLTRWIVDAEIDVVIVVGGADTDAAGPALKPLVTQVLPGFTDLFRWLMFQEAGASAMLSSAEAAQCTSTFVFVLPGAIEAAMDKLILPQFDPSTTPRNLVAQMPRLLARLESRAETDAEPARADAVPVAIVVEKTQGGSGLVPKLPAMPAPRRDRPRTGANVIVRGHPPEDPPTKPIDLARLEREIARSHTGDLDVTRPTDLAKLLPRTPPGADELVEPDDDYTETETLAVPALDPPVVRARPPAAPSAQSRAVPAIPAIGKPSAADKPASVARPAPTKVPTSPAPSVSVPAPVTRAKPPSAPVPTPAPAPIEARPRPPSAPVAPRPRPPSAPIERAPVVAVAPPEAPPPEPPPPEPPLPSPVVAAPEPVVVAAVRERAPTTPPAATLTPPRRPPTSPPPAHAPERTSGEVPARGMFTDPARRRGLHPVVKVLLAVGVTALGFLAVVLVFRDDASPTAASPPIAAAGPSAPPVPPTLGSSDPAAVAAQPEPEPEIEMEPAGAASPHGGSEAPRVPRTATRPVEPRPQLSTAVDAGVVAKAGVDAGPATEATGPVPPPADECDETACVLGNYDRPCCAKYKPTTTDLRPRVGGVPEELDRTMVRAAISTIKPRVVACGEKAGVKGTVKIAVTVTPAGAVSAASVDESPEPELGSCVLAAMRSVKFGQSINGGSFTYPFSF